MTCHVRALAAGLGLAAVLAVFAAAPAAAQTASIISTPANGTHYVLGEEIRTRITHGQVFGVAGGAWNTIYMRINIGGTVRQASIREGYRVRATVHTFRYTVTRDDVDTDGITIPANSIGGPSWRSFGFGTVNRNHAALNNQAAHKVIGSEARVTSSNPGWLTFPTLNTATLTVTLTGSTFGSSVAASNFTINASPAITGLSISGASATSGGTTATLTLGYTGSTTLTGDRTFTVTVAAAAHAGTINLTTNTVTVGTIPTPTLAVSPTSIAENGGVATVTATLDKPLIQPVTVTATAEAGTNAAAGDFTQTGTTLTFPAGTTASTGLITLTAVDNDTDGPNKTVRVTGSSATGSQARSPSDATMTITDDDAAPTPTLVLSATSIAENGGVSTVTATLSHPSSQPTTVTLAAAAQGGLQASDYTQAGNATLTIAAGATTTTDNYRFTAVDNDVDAPDKSLRISATVANGHGAGTAQNVTLTFTDDEAAPGVTLALDPASVSENGGVATVTATLSGPSSEASTVTVSAVPGVYTVGTDATITIAAGSTTAASDTVLVTAVDDSVHQGSAGRTQTVTAALTNGHGAGAVTGATLTLTDDETLPTAALDLDPSSIAENGEVSTVTATLSGMSSEAVTVTVAAAAGTGAAAADFDLSAATTLTIAAGSTTSAGTVTVTANDNNVDSPAKSVTVSGTAAGGNGVANPPSATLILTDDETLPTVTLVLPTSVSENGGIATVTAALSGPSSEAVTVTVATAAVASSGAVAGDFTQTGTTLTIAAGAAISTGTVTVTAVDNAVDAADKQVTVSATAVGGNGVANPANATLTLADDETLPMATLILTPSSISEDGGVSTVTATLSGPSSAAVTLTVGTTAVSPAIQTDFTQAGTTLIIAAGGTTSTGTVTVTAVGNILVSGSKRVTVSATAAGGNNVADPVSATLTLRDNEFRLGESAVSGQATEGGGQATFTVVLRMPPTAAVTVSVTSRDTGEGTVEPSSLTFTTGNWNTAQTVTVTGVDDDVDDGTVTWSVRLDPSSGDTTYDGLDSVDVVVTTTDDDTAGVEVSPSAGLVTAEGGGREATFTVRLATEPLGDVVLDVASTDTTEGAVDTDAQMNGAQSTLTFTTTNWSSAQTVTVTGVDDALTDGDQSYTVTLAVNQADTADATYDALGTVSVSVVNRDDEGATADVNGDGAIGALDGLLMYYAYTFRTVFELENDLGRRVRAFLRTLRGPTSPPANDAGYKAMLDDAWNWQRADSTAGDVNGDGSIGALDGLLMYYAYTFRTVFELENDLGRRVRAFLRTLRGPGSPPANDAGYKTMLNNAWGL